jgi:hypothetical protein
VTGRPGFIIDHPDPTAMKYISLYYRLKMEVNMPGGPVWRQPPSKMCRAILIDKGEKDPGPRKAKVYNAFGRWLLENDYIRSHETIL